MKKASPLLIPNRRLFLSAMGLGTSGLFLPSLVRAQETPPKRFLLLYTAQGCAPQRWECNPTLQPENEDWYEDWTNWEASTFSDSLKPLQPFASKCSAIGGMGLVSCASDGSGVHHERSKAHGPTGADAKWIGGMPYGGDLSVDQIIANEIARSDRYRSLECSVRGGLDYDGQGGSALYRGPGQLLPTIDQPLQLWNRLFANQLGEANPITAQQSSVLDLVSERYTKRAERLSNSDRQKLSSHRDLIRDLEQRVLGIASAQCNNPPEEPLGSDSYEDDFALQIQLISAAFSCDLTRVASIQMGQLTPTQLNLPAGSMHDLYAHGIYYNQDAEDAMAAYMAYHSAQLAQIIELFDSIPEGGGSLLDNTVILWITELADSWHGMDRYPMVVAGGANSGLQLGRYIHHARTTPFETPKHIADPYMGVPHNRMLVSICQAMGLDRSAVGKTEVIGWDGSIIDCTGALPMVLT